MPVGLLGLGTLGKVLARRLIDQGTDLVVWNRTRSKAEDLEVPIAESPAEVTGHCDVIILNLFDSNAVRAVLGGKQGVLSADVEGKTIIDTTTNHFKTVELFHGMCAERKAHYVEAPVLGSVVPASQGALTIAISGADTGVEAARPYLEMLGKNLFYFQKPGIATRMKLINNLALGSFMATLAEALVLGESCGIDREKVLDVLGAGAGNSGVLNAKRQKLLDNDFEVHFASRAIYKDLHYVQDLARDVRRTAFMAAAPKELFGVAAVKGNEDDDLSVVYKILRDF